MNKSCFAKIKKLFLLPARTIHSTPVAKHRGARQKGCKIHGKVAAFTIFLHSLIHAVKVLN